MVDTSPNSDEYLIAGDWNGDGKDTVAWVTRQSGGLQFHPMDGPNAGGLMIDTTPTSDEYLIAGDWDGGTSTGGDCTATNSCTPTTFANALLAYASAPVTVANAYAITKWERMEGGGAGCGSQRPLTAPWSYSRGPAGNPLATTQREPGSTSWNSVGVQVFADADGHTCWYWGLKANGDVLVGTGFYGNILAVLRSPVSDPTQQCDRLAVAVAASPWGTANFSSLC
jgi:hypothetical protein